MKTVTAATRTQIPGPPCSICNLAPGAFCQISSQRKPPRPTKWSGRTRWTWALHEYRPAPLHHPAVKRGAPRHRGYWESHCSPKTNSAAGAGKTVWPKMFHPSPHQGWCDGLQNPGTGKAASVVRSHDGKSQSRLGMNWASRAVACYSNLIDCGIHVKPSL